MEKFQIPLSNGLADLLCQEALQLLASGRVSVTRLQRCLLSCSLLTAEDRPLVRRVRHLLALRQRVAQTMRLLQTNAAQIARNELASLVTLAAQDSLMAQDVDVVFLQRLLTHDNLTLETLEVLCKEVCYDESEEIAQSDWAWTSADQSVFAADSSDPATTATCASSLGFPEDCDRIHDDHHGTSEVLLATLCSPASPSTVHSGMLPAATPLLSSAVKGSAVGVAARHFDLPQEDDSMQINDDMDRLISAHVVLPTNEANGHGDGASNTTNATSDNTTTPLSHVDSNAPPPQLTNSQTLNRHPSWQQRRGRKEKAIVRLDGVDLQQAIRQRTAVTQPHSSAGVDMTTSSSDSSQASQQPATKAHAISHGAPSAVEDLDSLQSRLHRARERALHLSARKLPASVATTPSSKKQTQQPHQQQQLEQQQLQQALRTIACLFPPDEEEEEGVAQQEQQAMHTPNVGGDTVHVSSQTGRRVLGDITSAASPLFTAMTATSSSSGFVAMSSPLKSRSHINNSSNSSPMRVHKAVEQEGFVASNRTFEASAFASLQQQDEHCSSTDNSADAAEQQGEETENAHGNLASTNMNTTTSSSSHSGSILCMDDVCKAIAVDMGTTEQKQQSPKKALRTVSVVEGACSAAKSSSKEAMESHGTVAPLIANQEEEQERDLPDIICEPFPSSATTKQSTVTTEDICAHGITASASSTIALQQNTAQRTSHQIRKSVAANREGKGNVQHLTMAQVVSVTISMVLMVFVAVAVINGGGKSASLSPLRDPLQSALSTAEPTHLLLPPASIPVSSSDSMETELSLTSMQMPGHTESEDSDQQHHKHHPRQVQLAVHAHRRLFGRLSRALKTLGRNVLSFIFEAIRISPENAPDLLVF